MIVRFLSKPVLILFTLIALLALLLPQNFVIAAPGPTSNLLGKAVEIKASDIFPEKTFENGALYSTAIYVTNPGQHPLGFQVLQAWIDGNLLVLPTNAIYDVKASPKVANAQQKQEMVESQLNGALAALNFIKKIPKYPKPTWSESDVKIVMKKVGGGSAGLAFALALIAKSADPQLIGTRKIAATGTISQDGKVGPIGGVDLKVLSAHRAGATIFLMPKSNCSGLSKYPKGMQIFAVNNLSEAVHALAGANPSSYSCAKR